MASRIAPKLTDDAAALLAADDASWAKFVKTDAKAKMIADRYVIINASIALSEDYVATPEKRALSNPPTKAGERRSERSYRYPARPVLA